MERDRLRGFVTKLALFAILRIDCDRVSKTRIALYLEEDGSCPFIEWFDKLPAKVQDKCFLRLGRLREMGHELRRPEADFLRDGIYETARQPGRGSPPDLVPFPHL